MNHATLTQRRASRRSDRPRWLTRLLDGVERRFRRARSGSILILVVALLVLLALIGTAFITTTGTDRVSAAQNVANTEADLLVQGVLDLMTNQIVAKVAPVDAATGKNSYRPAVANSTPAVAISDIKAPIVPTYFSNVDYAAYDSWLASKTPSLNDSTRVNVTPWWQHISANPLAGARNATNGNLFTNQFVSPQNGTYYSTRYGLQPTSVSITVNGIARAYPAFIVRDAADTTANGKTFLAADADGDGIADAGLFELPIGQINGVRYFAAVRVVDNSAAINAAVAWEPVPNTASAPNLSPANIALRRLLDATEASATPFNNFNLYRLGQDPTNGITTANQTPIRDDGAAANFRFFTPYDAYWTMLGSRLSNPGYNTSGNKYRSLGMGDAAAMAYRGGLPNKLMSSSTLEQYFPNGTRNVYSTFLGSSLEPFAPNQASTWWSRMYDYQTLSFANADRATPVRPLLTSWNAVTNDTPGFNGQAMLNESERAGQYQFRGNWVGGTLYHIGEWVWYNGRSYVCCRTHMDPTQTPAVAAVGGSGTQPNYAYWDEVPWHSNPVKINVNTAGFGALMAAYCAVMGDGPETKIPGTTADLGYGTTGPQVWTFGNAMRNGGQLTPVKTKQLRAALAALSTIDLRDADDDVSSRTVFLTEADGSGGVRAQVYGTERQPYVTEALAQVNAASLRYVVVELFNPYPSPLKLDAFRLAYRDRASGAITPIGSPLSGVTIPAFGYYYIQSSTDDAVKPVDVTPPTPNRVEQALEELIAPAAAANNGRELLLLRTRLYSGQAMTSTDPANSFNENNLSDLVPADQLDFSGIQMGNNIMPDPANGGQAIPATDRYHYRRATANSGTLTNPWHCVYGGPYDTSANAVGGNIRKQWGWIRDKLTPAVPPVPPAVPNWTGAGFGSKASVAAGGEPARNDNTPGTLANTRTATYRTRTLQVNNEGMPGPWKPNSTNAANPYHPCGGFARTGDILDVVYVGGYAVQGGGNGFEMNSVSLDSAYADDGDQADDVDGSRLPIEQLGRFCPIYLTTYQDLAATKPLAAAPIATQRYAWARDLFEYLTTQCPQDDYLPNVDPTIGRTGSGDPTLAVPANQNAAKWPYANLPQAVANGPSVTNPNLSNHGNEDAASVQGLINVNTANWRVLATVPWSDNPNNNIQFAKNIVTYRESHGPYHNLFELMLASGIPTAAGAVSQNPSLGSGDLSPFPGNVNGSVVDNVAGDYEARYLVLKRVSNMVTFRSDTFTVYVVVQGWRNPGTSVPELVVQRRAAMIVDRSTVKPTLGQPGPAPGDIAVSAPTITTVPNN